MTTGTDSGRGGSPRGKRGSPRGGKLRGSPRKWLKKIKKETTSKTTEEDAAAIILPQPANRDDASNPKDEVLVTPVLSDNALRSTATDSTSNEADTNSADQEGEGAPPESAPDTPAAQSERTRFLELASRCFNTRYHGFLGPEDALVALQNLMAQLEWLQEEIEDPKEFVETRLEKPRFLHNVGPVLTKSQFLESVEAVRLQYKFRQSPRVQWILKMVPKMAPWLEDGPPSGPMDTDTMRRWRAWWDTLVTIPLMAKLYVFIPLPIGSGYVAFFQHRRLVYTGLAVDMLLMIDVLVKLSVFGHYDKNGKPKIMGFCSSIKHNCRSPKFWIGVLINVAGSLPYDFIFYMMYPSSEAYDYGYWVRFASLLALFKLVRLRRSSWKEIIAPNASSTFGTLGAVVAVRLFVCNYLAACFLAQARFYDYADGSWYLNTFLDVEGVTMFDEWFNAWFKAYLLFFGIAFRNPPPTNTACTDMTQPFCMAETYSTIAGRGICMFLNVGLFLFVVPGSKVESSIRHDLECLNVPGSKIRDFMAEVRPIQRQGPGLDKLQVLRYHSLSPQFVEMFLNEVYFFKEILEEDGFVRDIAPHAEFLQNPTTEVFHEGDPAFYGYLYFVYNGLIKLSKRSRTDEDYGMLQTLDMFGTEVFLSDPKCKRRLSAEAVTRDCIILRVHVRHIVKLYGNYPTLKEKMIELAKERDRFEAGFGGDDDSTAANHTGRGEGGNDTVGNEVEHAESHSD